MKTYVLCVPYSVTGLEHHRGFYCNTIVLQSKDNPYYLVAGNTYNGVYKNDGPHTVYISLHYVPELNQQTTVGARDNGITTIYELGINGQIAYQKLLY